MIIKEPYMMLGPEKTVRTDKIIGIFDTDSATSSPVTAETLRILQQKNKIGGCLFDLPKSFILTTDGDILFSTYNTATHYGKNKSKEK